MASERVFFIVILALSPTVAHGSNNIALGKPTASSLISFGGSPGRAVDGNPDPVFGHASCMMADGNTASPLPWWQVDLERQYYIQTVALTNREDAFTFRLREFTIEVYSEDPTSNPTTPKQVCSVYPGTVAAGAREVLMCASGVMGRYLRVQKNTMYGDDALHICEAEVFGQLSTRELRSVFSRVPGKRLQGTPLSQESGTAAECGRICFDTIFCDGFNFDVGSVGGTGTCQLMSQSENPVTDPGYDYYK